MMSVESTVSSCPNCQRVMVSINGNMLQDSCPYCGESLEVEEAEDDVEDQVIVDEDDGLDRDALSLLHLTKKVECWYCHEENDFSNQKCSNCGWDLSVITNHRESNEETKLSNQMTEQQKETCLITGLISFIKILMKRNGDDSGMIRCKQKGCNGGVYPHDSFTCPYCGKPSLLQELRDVLHGTLRNKSILQLIQQFFPQFNIIKYTTSAMMQHERISAAKIDLESAASETSSIIETAAVFLKSVTASPTTRKKSNNNNNSIPSEPALETFRRTDTSSPDNRILDLLRESAVNVGSNNGEGMNAIAEDDGESDDESDWLNP